jgi:hypothetical protein
LMHAAQKSGQYQRRNCANTCPVVRDNYEVRCRDNYDGRW